MIPTLVGALVSGGFNPVAIVGPTNQTAPVPAGASTVDAYLVYAGVNATNVSGGGGGDCKWGVGIAVIAGSTGITIDFSKMLASWAPSGTAIFMPSLNPGGAARATAGSTGAASATDIAAGAAGVLDSGSTPGPASVTTGSALAGYVGHGGDSSSSYNGVGWGAGGGCNSSGSVFGTGGPPGALFIFK